MSIRAHSMVVVLCRSFLKNYIVSVVFARSNFGIFHKIRKWSVSVTFFLVLDFALSGYIPSFLWGLHPLFVNLPILQQIAHKHLIIIIHGRRLVPLFIIPEHFSVSCHSFSSSTSISFELSSFRFFPKHILWAHLISTIRLEFVFTPILCNMMNNRDIIEVHFIKPEPNTVHIVFDNV